MNRGPLVRTWSVGLADALRSAGVVVGTGQVIACQQALAELGADRRDRYLAARTCLVSGPEDLAVFDRVFAAYDREAPDGTSTVGSSPPADMGIDEVSDGSRPAGRGSVEFARAGALASERERLRYRRFDQVTDEERERIARLLQQLSVAVPRRTSRRRRPGRGPDLDLARTLEQSMATDGELIDRAWRRRRPRPRRLVLVLDVSGSMADYARMMLRFAVAARRTADRDPSSHVEVFAFGTRLTRLSDALAERDADRAIAAAAERVVDWDGGTRIGASVDALVRIWGRRGILTGAVVVICSDGLERGDPGQLASAMARLRRHAHRIVWVNPLAGDEHYLPTQRGMVAALPHIDVLLPGHTLDSLEQLATTLRAVR